MTLAISRRWLLLSTALALSLAASGWLAAQESGVVEAVARTPERAVRDTAPGPAGAASEPVAVIRLESLARAAPEPEVKDLFAARSWQAPPAAPAQQTAPPPPTAPQMPFAYLGKMVQNGAVTVFLSYQDRNLAVKPGEVIDGTYRVDSIQGPLLTLTYLPLETQQTLHIGDAN